MTTPQPGYSNAVPLSQPLYGASLGDAVRRFFKKYATFTGRASRSEYWWWALVSFVVITVLQSLAFITGGPGGVSADGTTYEGPGAGYLIFNIILFIYSLAVLVPTLALLVRRLHDGNFSGFFAFLLLIPFLGPIIIFVLALLPSKPEGARFDA
ncbi:hypothetical protein ASF06_07190 [Agreia sp. Leaf244]|uniref:DUF805 domain-containing protein n=1 Tax=Agreia sp. Leaf244 TaxID=1736305 RepID=UPI0006FA5BF4|nr:DUF805 domain-containing protein [Agreia sp. Leaf244]KQO10521.1 hypothetical protein ASF06_07190 [Agreia sp. Leaf244]